VTLSEKQQLFVYMIAQLISYAQGKGLRLTLGKAERKSGEGHQQQPAHAAPGRGF